MSTTKYWSLAFLTASLLLASAPVAAATYPATRQRPLYVPGEVVVKYKPGMRLELKAAALRDLSVQEEKPLGGIPRLNVLRLPQGADVMQAVQRLEASGQVEYAEPNYYRYPTLFTVEPTTGACNHTDYATLASAPAACLKPNDPLIGQQWYAENTATSQLHNDVGLTAAWGLFCSPSGPTTCSNSLSSPSKVKDFDIAIIDDGFDLTNPDLTGNFLPGTSCLGTSACLPTSTFAAMATATDGSQDHGTYVASTLAALGGNGLAMAGVLWSAKILPIKTDLSDTGIINGIDYAVHHGKVKIINESFGGPIPSLAEYDALLAAENAGILVVVSAGNSDSDNDRAQAAYPANYAAQTVIFPKVDGSGNPEFGTTTSKPGLPNVIAVAASDDTDHLTSFSQWGSYGVNLLAPGEGIIALQRGANGGTAIVAGTSFSSPVTAGVAGLVGQYLILNSNPLTPDWHDLKEHLLNGTESSQTPATGNMDGRSATGRLNAYLAMQNVTHGVIVVRNVTISGGSGDGEINPGDSAIINVKVANIGEDETGVTGTLTYAGSDGAANVTGGAVTTAPMTRSGSSPNIVDSTAVVAFPVTFGSFSGNKSLLFHLAITTASGGAEDRYFYLEAGSLSNNVTVNGLLSRNVYDDFQDYHIDVPTGGKNLVIYTTTPGEVDIDLLVEKTHLPQYLETIGVAPASDPEFQQYIDPNSQSSGRADGDESVAYDGLPDQNPVRFFDPVSQPFTTPGTYHIVVVNFTGNSHQPYTLTACYAAPSRDEITFSGNYEYDEAAGKATLTLLRSGSLGAVSVTYATSNGGAYPGNVSATAGSNYTASSGTVNWASGDSSAKTITVPIIDTGAIPQGASNFKHFQVDLSNPTGGVKLGCIKDADVAIGNPKTVIPASGGSGGGGGGGGSSGGKSGGGGVTDLLSLLALGFAAARRRRKSV